MTLSTEPLRARADWHHHKHHLFAAIRKEWGIQAFQPLQQPAIEAVLRGLDLLAVMPPGSGKDLCYFAPALYSDGLTVVLAPRNTIKADQVSVLNHHRIPFVIAENTKFDPEERDTEERAKAGKIRLLFALPEHVSQQMFITMLDEVRRRQRLDAFVVEEAHRLSYWSRGFQSSYAALGKLRKIFADVPIHAFTPSASRLVCDEIELLLRLRQPCRVGQDIEEPQEARRTAG